MQPRRRDRSGPYDPRSQRLGLEAERIEHGLENGVVLKTVSASPRADQLALRSVQIDQNLLAKQHRQIFKRDRVGMERVQRLKCFERGRAGTGVSDAGKIGVEIDRHEGLMSDAYEIDRLILDLR